MSGQLFTQYFLTDGIKTTFEWRALLAQPEVFSRFRDDLRRRYEALSGFQSPNESVTEQKLIRPILELLGWVDYLSQQGASRNEDIPDHLLFENAESMQRAAAKRQAGDCYVDALVVEESKRFERALDARDQAGKAPSRTPHGQILRYLSTADIVSNGRIRWGILTNGRVWRLYDHRARPRADGYFEAELPAILEPDNEESLRVFYLLFQRDSFTRQEGQNTTFLEYALAEGKRYEERVAQDLSGVVFERVFPQLVEALAKDVTAPTNMQSMIATSIPGSGAGNTLPIISEDGPSEVNLSILLANFNAIPFDYVARQKIQGQHLNWFIVEQLPVVPLDRYETIHFGLKTAGQIVRESVLELTYTAHDMAPFARNLGHVDETGQVKPPFIWNEDRRLHLRTKLDAVFFHLYGVTNREDVRYIYSTFPIVERQEKKAHGRYYSRDLCLAWINALAAGRPDAEIHLFDQ